MLAHDSSIGSDTVGKAITITIMVSLLLVAPAAQTEDSAGPNREGVWSSPLAVSGYVCDPQGRRFVSGAFQLPRPQQSNVSAEGSATVLALRAQVPTEGFTAAPDEALQLTAPQGAMFTVREWIHIAETEYIVVQYLTWGPSGAGVPTAQDHLTTLARDTTLAVCVRANELGVVQRHHATGSASMTGVGGPLIVPLKIRPGWGGAEFAVSTDVFVAGSFGLRWRISAVKEHFVAVFAGGGLGVVTVTREELTTATQDVEFEPVERGIFTWVAGT